MTASTRRLFFALWPDDETRREIVARRDSLGRVGRRVPDGNLHLTLVFLGDQPAERVPEFKSAASALHAINFELRLDRFGWFPRARVAWLGGRAPEALVGLQAGLHSAMDKLDVKLDRRPFRPHVTLFRKVARRPVLPEMPPLIWPVDRFVLVESVSGQPYRVLESWSLWSQA